jgi:rhodanese-related sulfurtransferase
MYNLFNNIFKGSSNPSSIEEYLKKGAYLIDVRTPMEFASGHVEGSVNIPLDILHQYIPELQRKSHIIVFCRTGNRSGMAKSMLEANGIQNVINGGAWQEVKRAIEKIKNLS